MGLALSRRTVLTGSALAGAGLLLFPQAAQAQTFLDVPANHPFASEINWLASRGISTGWATPAGREFRPAEAISRAAMAAFLYRQAGSPAFTAPARSPFIDMKTSDPFYREITWLSAKGISTGWATPAGREFRPAEAISRAAIAAFLYRQAGSPAFTAPARSPFLDIRPNDAFYKEITWLAEQKITTGWATPAGREFRPTEAVSRAAMAAFLYRFSQLPQKQADVTPDQVRAEILRLVNAERAKVGARPLKLNSAITTVAQNWSGVMAKEDKLYHNPSYHLQIPRNWKEAAENIAMHWKTGNGSTLAANLMKSWMDSPGHRENILNPNLTDLGFGFTVLPNNKVYACQVFAQY